MVRSLRIPIALLLSMSVMSLVRAQEAPVTPPANSPVVRDGHYVLQVGDEVAIRVYPQADLNEVVRVRPDGRISTVLIDDVDVAGRTARELDDLITAEYVKLFKNPSVTIIVREFANVKVYVGGEVGQPGTIPLVGEMTVVGAVFQSGGFRSTARTDNVVLVRNESGKAVARRLNVERILSRGEGDVKLQPFDVVYVPLSRIAAVDRFVDQYVRQLIPVSLNAGFSYILGDRVLIR
jgi:protein involved in polysaccharide export with SLBB domain